MIFLQYCSYSIFYLLDEFKQMAQPMYKPLIKEQEEEVQVPEVLKKQAEKFNNRGSGGGHKQEEEGISTNDAPKKQQTNQRGARRRN